MHDQTKVDAVARMRKEGFKASVIQEALGLTPGQLAGIIYRLRAGSLTRPVALPTAPIATPQTIEPLDISLGETDRDRDIISMWNKRHQAAYIGECLGISARAVQGCIGRMINKRDGIKRKIEYAPPPNRRKVGRGPVPPPPEPMPQLERPRAIPAHKHQAFIPRKLTEVGPAKCCQWPMWGHHEHPTHEYCGEQVARPGLPYCVAHTARAYVPYRMKDGGRISPMRDRI